METDDSADAVPRGERQTPVVTDDFGDAQPVTQSELDAVEAFLMPLIRAALNGDDPPADKAGDPSGKGFQSAAYDRIPEDA